MSGSLTSRAIAAGVIWIACALGLGGWAINGVFQGSISRQFDARLEAELDLLTARIAESDSNPAGRMSNPDFLRAYSGTYWQAYAADGRQYRSRSLWDTELPVPETVDGEYRKETGGPGDRSVRLLARTVTMPDGMQWTLAVGRDRSGLQKEVAAFQRTLLLSAALFGAVLLISAFLLLRIALAPLRRLHRAVQGRQLRSGPIEGPYPSEIAPLVDDLNRMLTRNERLRERGRLQAANLAHALKTPAAILANELAKARRGDPLDLTLSTEAVDNIAAAAERHLGLADAGPEDGPVPASTDAVPVAREVVRAIRRIYPDQSLEIAADRAVLVRADRSEITEVLGNIVDNAAKWARGKVRLSLSGKAGLGAITVEDDGPGVPVINRDRILEQGVRLDETRSGTGLGLTIVADIVERHGGRIRMARSSLGGLKLVVELPAGQLAASHPSLPSGLD